MPCDTRLKPRQTITQRAAEVRSVVDKLAGKLASGQVKTKIGPTGGVAFVGLTDEERDGVTDACMYRRVMATGSALAKAAIARAEQLAGRAVNRQAVAHGHHSHDNGVTWHHHKG
jgi:hypothetical protein